MEGNTLRTHDHCSVHAGLLFAAVAACAPVVVAAGRLVDHRHNVTLLAILAEEVVRSERPLVDVCEVVGVLNAGRLRRNDVLAVARQLAPDASAFGQLVCVRVHTGRNCRLGGAGLKTGKVCYCVMHPPTFMFTLQLLIMSSEMRMKSANGHRRRNVKPSLISLLFD